jgi:hypothetical protein
VGTLAFILAATGIVAARVSHPASAQAQRRSAGITRAAATPAAIASPAASPDTESATEKAQDRPAKQSPVEQATMAPILEDGVYPSYIRGVNIEDATVTVDVVQVFEEDAAVKAAVEDGKPRSEAKYLYIYVRNENGLFRTLPVSEDVRIRFIGGCESGDRRLALEELSKETRPFNTSYYYSVYVTNGEIDHIVQHLAISAC